MRSFILLATGISLSLFLSGCDTNGAKAEIRNDAKPATLTAPTVLKKTEVSTQKINTPFLDNKTIAANGKPMVVIFGSKTCTYCDALKNDIKESQKLEEVLAKEFSSYYVTMDTLSEHDLVHEKQTMKTTNKMLAEIYGINATPSLIFYDDTGLSLFRVPGYMPKEQFLVTLEFVTSRAWEGAEKNSAAMYEKLKTFYAQNGIIK